MLNRVTLIGNLGADPETRFMPNGGQVTNISLATTKRWKDKTTGEKREATEWHRVNFFNRLAEVVAEYLKKGSQVYVEGEIRTRKWQDNDGNDRYSTEIIADQMQMLGGKGDQGNQGGQSRPQQQRPQQNQAPQPPAGGYDDFEDDIPFNSLNSMIRNHLI